MATGPDKGLEAILIAGPTASGKSALALALAERIGGLVINADSMQVYAELRILTARPSAGDEARAPHRLYGHVPLEAGYSVGRWLEDARAALDEARAHGQPAIVVGGTGLYFKALTEGLSPMPSVPSDVRARVRERLEAIGPQALHAELARSDREASQAIRPGDGQRVARALEILLATGRPLSDWQRARREGAVVDSATARRIVLWPDRAELRARIDARVGEMLVAGALDEARCIAERNPDPGLPGYRAHGLRPLIAHLRGEMTLDEAAELTRAQTRQYAKRQITWFRHQMEGWEKLDPELAMSRLVKQQSA
jgi:tRNA dimethylallyltransferase